MSFALYFFCSFLFNYRVKRRIHFSSEKLKRVLIIKMYITISGSCSVTLFNWLLILSVLRAPMQEKREKNLFFLQLTQSVRCFCFSLWASHSVIFLCGFRFTILCTERDREKEHIQTGIKITTVFLFRSFFFNRLKLNCIQRLCAVHCLCAYDCNIFWWPLK